MLPFWETVFVILSETERSEESLVSKPIMCCKVNEISVKRFFSRSSCQNDILASEVCPSEFIWQFAMHPY